MRTYFFMLTDKCMPFEGNEFQLTLAKLCSVRFCLAVLINTQPLSGCVTEDNSHLFSTFLPSGVAATYQI